MILDGFAHKACEFHYETYDLKKPVYFDFCWSYRKRRDLRLEEFKELFETDEQYVKMLYTYIIDEMSGGLGNFKLEYQ